MAMYSEFSHSRWLFSIVFFSLQEGNWCSQDVWSMFHSRILGAGKNWRLLNKPQTECPWGRVDQLGSKRYTQLVYSLQRQLGSRGFVPVDFVQWSWIRLIRLVVSYWPGIHVAEAASKWVAGFNWNFFDSTFIWFRSAATSWWFQRWQKTCVVCFESFDKKGMNDDQGISGVPGTFLSFPFDDGNILQSLLDIGSFFSSNYFKDDPM